MSARTVTIQPNDSICNLEQIKVFNRDPIKDISSAEAEAGTNVQHKAASVNKEIDHNLEEASLTQDQKQHAINFLSEWKHIFSQSPSDFGRTNLVEHEIHLTDDHPFKEPFQNIPPALEEVREHLKEMLQAGVIRESTSPFSSNVVIVRKKVGTICFCIDYRKLNQRTEKDAYPIPRFDDTLHSLAGSKYFTTLDLRSGYWQVELNETDKAKTAFQVGSRLL